MNLQMKQDILLEDIKVMTHGVSPVFLITKHNIASEIVAVQILREMATGKVNVLTCDYIDFCKPHVTTLTFVRHM